MVEMPTREEKWFESVLYSKYDGKYTVKFHADGNIAMEASSLNRVIRWDLTSGRAELDADTRHVAMVLRYLGLEKSTLVVTHVAKRPRSEEFLLLAGVKHVNPVDATLYRSVTMRVNYLFLHRPDLSFAAGSLARGMRRPNGRCLRSCLNHKHCLEFCRCSAMQTMLQIWEHASPIKAP